MRCPAAAFLSLLLFLCPSPAQAEHSGFLGSPQETETIQKLVMDLESQSKSDQIRAAQVLGEIGPAAEGAVPVLVKVIRTGSPEVRVVCSIALLKIDSTMKDMIPILLRALEKEGQQEEDPQLTQQLGLQEDALHKWSSLMRAKVDPQILPLLVQALKESDPDIRVLGVLVLGGVARQLPEALPYVLKAFKDPDQSVRGAVIGALARVGPNRKGVVPGILKGLKDPEPDVRVRTVAALDRLGPGVEETVPALARALNDKDPRVRSGALKVLELFGPAAKKVAPEIAAHTGRGSPEERLAAVSALLKLDSAQSERVVPLLILLFQDPSLEPPLRLQAADLLERSGFKPKRGQIDGIVALLSDPVAEVRARAARLLSWIGAPAVPALRKALESGDGTLRSGALQALAGMRPLSSDVVSSLALALKDKDRSIRYIAAESLGDLGVLAQDAVPALVQALGDSEESVRDSAGNALTRMGPPAAAALTEVSRSGDPVLKLRAGSLLQKMSHESS